MTSFNSFVSENFKSFHIKALFRVNKIFFRRISIFFIFFYLWKISLSDTIMTSNGSQILSDTFVAWCRNRCNLFLSSSSKCAVIGYCQNIQQIRSFLENNFRKFLANAINLMHWESHIFFGKTLQFMAGTSINHLKIFTTSFRISMRVIFITHSHSLTRSNSSWSHDEKVRDRNNGENVKFYIIFDSGELSSVVKHKRISYHLFHLI